MPMFTIVETAICFSAVYIVFGLYTIPLLPPKPVFRILGFLLWPLWVIPFMVFGIIRDIISAILVAACLKEPPRTIEDAHRDMLKAMDKLHNTTMEYFDNIERCYDNLFDVADDFKKTLNSFVKQT